jgi:hypothetical protein
MIKNLNKKISFYSIIFLSIFIYFSFVSISYATTVEVYFQKESKEITKDDVFIVDLKISSLEEIVNVIDGKIIYDKNNLEIKNVTIDDSLLSLWIKEPVFDNDIGELSFIGGVPNGFEGKDGQILKITFFAKKEGATLIGFKDMFSVFINDGKGTSINPWLKPMSLSIIKKSDPLIKDDTNLILAKINNYKYYAGMFVLILLLIIIKLLLRFKRNGK